MWSHTSVNLDEAEQKARNEVGDKVNVISFIKKNKETNPIVARRHYICTGNLRKICRFPTGKVRNSRSTVPLLTTSFDLHCGQQSVAEEWTILKVSTPS